MKREPHASKSKRRAKSPPRSPGVKAVVRAMAQADAVEQNKAITDILRVITSTPDNLQPVFDAVVSHAIRLCQGSAATLWQYDGSLLHFGASRLATGKPGTGEAADYFRKNPLPLGKYNPTPQAALEKRTVHVLDVFADSKYRPLVPKDSFRTLPNAGTVLAVPLLRQEDLFGVISIWRFEKQLFTDQQVAMVEAFAAQAAMAIHNVRLHNETRQALDQQTATAEILKVISASPNEIQPVFESILENAMRLCDAGLGTVGLYDGKHYRHVAQRGGTARYADWLFTGPFEPTADSTLGRMIATQRPFHIADYRELASYREGNPRSVATVELGGTRSYLAVPMLKDRRVIGGITIRRAEVRPFTSKQIDLVSTFANQAVIAIENVRLFNETKEALEQQTAAADILKVISSSPTDTQPVFQAIAERAARICEASDARIFTVEGASLRYVAGFGELPMHEAGVLRSIEPGFVLGRALIERTARQVEDILAAAEQYPTSQKTSKPLGIRTILAVPLIREGQAVGGIILRRTEVRPFSEKQVALLKTFADQAAIAIENVRLFNETKEALEQQTATAEILRVISSTPTDIEPVFAAIVRSALGVFEGMGVGISLKEGNEVRIVAEGGNVFTPDAGHLLPLDRDVSVGARALVDNAVVNIADVEARGTPSFTQERARRLGFRAIAAAPMRRQGVAIGSIAVMRKNPGALGGKHIALLQTFADQAVIAIENVRLFNETKEALERQTATAEILKVISTSPTDVQPVFDAIVESAARLFGRNARIRLVEGNQLCLRARSDRPGQGAASAAPMPIDQESIGGRIVLERRALQVSDTEATGAPAHNLARGYMTGYRSIASAPLLREGAVVGVIGVMSPQPGALSEKQMSLLSIFANQAVIAIENVRLFNETKESLEQQTAISEVLRVISNSPTDVKPVLDAVAERAATICDAVDARILLEDGDKLRHIAGFGEMPIGVKLGDTIPLTRGSVAGRAMLERMPIHVEDLLAVPAEEFPVTRELRDRVGHRTILVVPLMREQRALGAITLRRMETRPFTEKQIALLKTFADQAAIAIENVRLFNETDEALKQQTATAEVLKTISRSTFDLEAVLQTLVDNAARLSGATRAVMHRPDENGVYAPVVTFNYEVDPPLVAALRARPIRPGRDSINGRALLEKRPVHVPDVLADPEYGRQDLAKAGGFRTVLSVPMLRDGEVIGLISLTKGIEIDPFTEKQIELVTTFADQAVIAIENVRLFEEIEQKSAQLEVANKHKSDFLANMSHELRTPLNAIIGFSEALMDRMFGEVNEKQADYLKDIHESGRHLLSLINDILDLSKIEAGRMDLEISSFDLPTALSNAMTLIRERAQRHGIELGLEVDQRLGEFAADERKFKQIMLNLLSNAVKFTPDGGRVDVCAKMDTDKIEIAVKDTGIGIAPEDQGAVFEEFKQVGRDQMRKAEGTGLGLALTRRFVELHGGAIRLESTPGKGSTFTVSLPLRQ